jgi:hypothetical protein
MKAIGRRRISSTPRYQSHPIFRSLYPLINSWLAEHPNVCQVIDDLQLQVRTGRVQFEDIVLLARKWEETLPPPRGVVKQLRDFMQLRLDVDVCPGKESRRKSRKGPRL